MLPGKGGGGGRTVHSECSLVFLPIPALTALSESAVIIAARILVTHGATVTRLIRLMDTIATEGLRH